MKRKWWLIGLLLAVALALLSPLASSSPDGLERVAGDKGFLDKAAGPIIKVIPDYLLPGISNKTLANIIAGLIGTLTLFGLAYGLAWLLRTRTQTRN